MYMHVQVTKEREKEISDDEAEDEEKEEKKDGDDEDKDKVGSTDHSMWVFLATCRCVDSGQKNVWEVPLYLLSLSRTRLN